jgi:hypothetical protein
VQQGHSTIEVRRKLRFARILEIYGPDFIWSQIMAMSFVGPARNTQEGKKNSQSTYVFWAFHGIAPVPVTRAQQILHLPSPEPYA